MVPIGMIHGRFQPFHNGHMDYLKRALGECRRLIVGITNPEPAAIVEVGSDDHRHRLDANPWSFYLRARMIQESIRHCPECGDRFADVTIVPFPVHTPAVWAHYVPEKDVNQFMRLLDPWDHEKRKVFEEFGWRIEIMDANRLTGGSDVRADIAAGGSQWRTNVPEGTRRVLELWLSGDIV